MPRSEQEQRDAIMASEHRVSMRILTEKQKRQAYPAGLLDVAACVACWFDVSHLNRLPMTPPQGSASHYQRAKAA